MTLRKKLALLAPITALSLGVWTTPAQAALRTVYQQAEDMHFSGELLKTLREVMPRYDPNADQPYEDNDARPRTARGADAAPVTTRAVRIVKTRQVANAVTEDDWSGKPKKSWKNGAKKDASVATKGASLRADENRDIEERMGREITEQMKSKGYEVQAVTAHMETLAAVKVVVLATISGLTESNAKERLAEMRTVIERDVLKSGYPNVALTRGSTFSVASTAGAKVSETSAMLYELDRPEFKPTLREKTIAIATPRPAAQAAIEPPPVARPRPPVKEEASRVPAAVSITDKEKAERAREQTSAAKAAPATTRPVSEEVTNKGRKQTITPNESDFQD